VLDTNVPMKRLFRSLCQEYYGSDASVVCNTLYHSTGKTFQQLCAESRLSAKRCAKALHTLLSHCCVKQTSHAIPASSHVNVYHLNTRRLLHVERAASYLQHIRKIFGGRAERITFCFFICGSLTLSELEKLLHPGKISERHRKQLRKILVTLYTCGIIELPVRNETKLLGNCSAIPEEVCSTAQLEETFNHAFISLNSDGINKKMREYESVHAVTSALDDPHAQILSYINTKSSDTLNRCVTLSALTSHCECTSKLTAKQVMDSVRLLQRCAYLSVSHLNDVSDEEWVRLNPEHALQTALSHLAQTTVKHRFGDIACRLFRLLLKTPQLEQKQISELAMIPLKDCREILGKLLKHEYVRMQEVARTTDHAPSRTNYLWKVHLPSVISKMKRELSETFVNLKTKHIEECKVYAAFSKVGGLRHTAQELQGAAQPVNKMETCLLRISRMMIVFDC